MASNCKVVVEEVKTGSYAVYGAILQEVRNLSLDFFSCHLVHEFRSNNFEAQNLAKFSLDLGVGLHAWLGQPGALHFVPVNIGDVLI